MVGVLDDELADRGEVRLDPVEEAGVGRGEDQLDVVVLGPGADVGGVSFAAIRGATGGWCDQKARRIVVDSGQPANAQLRILIHETIHALGVGYAEYGRAGRGDRGTATHLECSSVGLRVDGDTVA